MTNDTMAEMWAALEQLQPIADRNGVGPAWQGMLDKRTPAAAEFARRLCAYSTPRVQEDGGALAFMSLAANDAADALREHAKRATSYAYRALQAVRS